MERLETCYFCGAAEDAPLREVTVTPRRRQSDPDAAVTLTLCRSCERKLERVLGGLFDHVESRQSSRASEADAAPTDDATTESAGDPAEVPEAQPIDRIDVTAGEVGAEPADEEQHDDERKDEEPPDEPESDEEDAEILEEESSVTARATMNSKEALDGVSVAEYNRVMRLLQNREFPMARAAFVDLAANAYDLAEETVDSVLEAVIDQGALSDRAGELVRPGEEEPP